MHETNSTTPAPERKPATKERDCPAIPFEIVLDRRLKSLDVRVAFTLDYIAGRHADCYTPLPEIAAKSCCGEWGLKRSLARLAGAGWVAFTPAPKGEAWKILLSWRKGVR
jgi:hypothetical protein